MFNTLIVLQTVALQVALLLVVVLFKCTQLGIGVGTGVDS